MVGTMLYKLIFIMTLNQNGNVTPIIMQEKMTKTACYEEMEGVAKDFLLYLDPNMEGTQEGYNRFAQQLNKHNNKKKVGYYVCLPQGLKRG